MHSLNLAESAREREMEKEIDQEEGETQRGALWRARVCVRVCVLPNT